MTDANSTLCLHCLLPVGRRAMRRSVQGEDCTFCCYGCCIAYQVRGGSREEHDAAWLLVRLGAGGFLSMNIMLFSLLLYTDDFAGADAAVLPWIHLLLWLFATPAVVILGEPFAREAWEHARQGRWSASTLIVLGVGAAYAYSAFATVEGSRQVYFDTACMVLMLFTVGYYLDAAGRARAARDLAPLLAAESEMAIVVEGDAEQRRSVREVTSGMLLRVRPGERIPVDGTVVEGRSHADEAVITGECRAIEKGPDSSVIAGSINLDGPLLIRSSGAGNATRWAQICRSVREALLRRSPSQRLADRIVGVFVPVVLLLGLVTAAVWSRHVPFDKALLTGLAVLVVACPCAVGLAAPMATSLGIGRLARHGCLVRDPAALEALARTRLIAFDKTGTLTSGRARIIAIDSPNVDPDDVLARAAGLERHSEHGLGRAVALTATARGLVPIATQDVRVVPGRGITGNAGGEAVAAGNGELMRGLGWALAPDLAALAQVHETRGHSRVYVGWGGVVHAVLALDDTPLPDARATVDALHRRGLHAMLLTGDSPAAARRIASIVGIAEIEAGLSPEAKRAALDRRRREGLVAMVGDGLNDGPVLATADVGIAVGSATDLARETAALVLPPDGLWLLPYAVDVARSVRTTILSNLAWAFGYNFVAIGLATAGLLQPVLAAAVMAGSSLLVVLNSLRLERLPDPSADVETAIAPGPAAVPSLDANTAARWISQTRLS
ncbi:heavy metal translocating P-type ATPase [Bradyrhizobium prioriisuperbiae]|uniref:heavy metal translocating P-type ATPase n=1 Tax=Bradyrhizobium prioriisuperbiae TaxID=2854389 RepID=UPI0028F0C4CE|nr:heavy metal translocating P-type ATPase [Bradyrhizobium prioritasuperba]